MKKILIISGGSGNDALMHGIYRLNKDLEIKILVNAYDDGKSTGVCRKITNTLGVSDIRKNHFRRYKLEHKGKENQRILAFYNDRYDLPKGNELNFVLEKLALWGMEDFCKYVEKFFDSKIVKYLSFDDFSIANIVYSSMYKELGYKIANSIICEKFAIDDCVILNSYENVFIGAKTIESQINDESGIVNFGNKDDKIQNLTYKSESPIILNNDAILAINESDLIVISTGTFWSSIYPTLEYGQLYKTINKSKAKKIWLMNNEQDKDSFGVGSNEFISKVWELGLDVTQFTIIENLDACDLLQQKNDSLNVVYYHMGNINGKHDANKMAYAMFLEYYGIGKEKYDNILLDFDNTIYDKNKPFDIVVKILVEISKNKLASIISGNDYKTHIAPILQRAFSDNLYAFQNDIWADASSILYVSGEKKKTISQNVIKKESLRKIKDYLFDEFGITGAINDIDDTTCFKIKPLNSLERDLLKNLLNKIVFKELQCDDIKAIKAGKTTIDIVAKQNDKCNVFNEKSFGRCIYIGDELMDYGNDYTIAKLCDKSIQVESIYETNLIMKLLNENNRIDI